MIVKKLSKQKNKVDRIVVQSMSQKIVFMGTSNFAVPILKSLYQNGYPISVVYTQPPKKSNSKNGKFESRMKRKEKRSNFEFVYGKLKF